MIQCVHKHAIFYTYIQYKHNCACWIASLYVVVCYNVTYCVMLRDSPSSQNSSPVAVCWSSSATNSEKLFCLVAVVVSSGCCIGMIYPPRTWICGRGGEGGRGEGGDQRGWCWQIRYSHTLTGMISNGAGTDLVSSPLADVTVWSTMLYHFSLEK